ncbi:M14 family zinc carboxypeptidase [Flavobacterium sp.]|uniref:M14 family zinc carboxypeptidase n=1 Tax=Flavobacterium sp. TaxID=239 RepID=UPI003A94A332
MKNIITILVLSCSWFCSAQLFNPQKKEMTEKFFPEFEVEIKTPAFDKKNGFTKYDEMMPFLQKLVDSHKDIAEMTFIGKSQKGKDIPFIHINKKSAVNDKVKVWVQAGIHGNEPASTEGILYLIEQLLNNTEYSKLLDELEIGIIPMANIDGYNKQDRYAANGMDLNRDQTKLMVQESVYLKKTFTDFGAEVALDFHEFQPFRRDYLEMGTFGYSNPYDVMLLYTGNLNVPEELRDITQNKFIQNTKDLLATYKLTSHDYYTTSDVHGFTVFNQGSVNARASATSYALSNCVSTLVEVRGIDLGRTSFKRRIMTTFYIAISYMNTAIENKTKLREVLQQSETSDNEVVVLSKREASRSQLDFIDIESNTLVKEEVNLRDALKSQPVLKRDMPTAYIILPEQTALIEKLKVLGVDAVQLTTAKDIEVESYKIVKYKREARRYEGMHRQDVTTEKVTGTKSFPVGTYIVYTSQKNKGLAFETLEPEADNSFVSFGVLKTNLGEELPIYRYMKSKL